MLSGGGVSRRKVSDSVSLSHHFWLRSKEIFLLLQFFRLFTVALKMWAAAFSRTYASNVPRKCLDCYNDDVMGISDVSKKTCYDVHSRQQNNEKLADRSDEHASGNEMSATDVGFCKAHNDKESQRSCSSSFLEKFSRTSSCNVKCFSCNKVISNQILCAIGRAYHPECFVCHKCKRGLEGLMFGVNEEDQVLCRDDYTKAYSPICAQCNGVISPMPNTGETVRVVAMGKEFHIDCYKCQDCGTQLTDEADKRCYPLGNLLLCYFCHRDRKKPHRKVMGSMMPCFVNPNLVKLNIQLTTGSGLNVDQNGNYLPHPTSI